MGKSRTISNCSLKKKYILKKKYLISLIVLTSLFFFFSVFGISYAFFTSRVTANDYVITTGNLQLNFSNSNNEINLTNTYPLTNTEGLATDGYSFTITNNGNISTKYQLRLELDSNNTIPIEYIKLAYVKTKENSVNTNNSLSEPVLVSNLNATQTFIKDQVIEPSKTDGYTLKLWIDYSAPNDIQGKTFKAKIVIDSLQNIDDGYVFNSTKPIITLNKFADGNTDTIIPVNGTFTDPGILSVTDDKDLLTEQNVTVTGTVNTSQVGVYEINYSVTDSDNNTTTVIRTVAVGDEESLNIKHSIANVLAMYSNQQLSDNEAVFCYVIHGNDDMYLGCKLYDTLDNSLVEVGRGVIILTKDISGNTIHEVTATNDVQLELNGKTVSVTGDYTLKNTGNLVITDSVGTGTITNTDEKALYNLGNLIIKGGTYSASSNCGLCTKGGSVVIDNANITADSYSAIRNRNNSNIVINNATISSNTESSIENENGTLIINGGTFISNSFNSIFNYSTGTININQKDLPIYIASFSKTWAPAIVNNDGGIIKINGDLADNCTYNSNSTTVGLCVYASNDDANSTNAAVQNVGDGSIYLNGGTYYGVDYGITAYGNGLIAINNVDVSAANVAINNNSDSGIINVCSSSVKGNNFDLVVSSPHTGSIYYQDNNSFSSNSTEPKMSNGSGTIQLNNSIICTSSN